MTLGAIETDLSGSAPNTLNCSLTEIARVEVDPGTKKSVPQRGSVWVGRGQAGYYSRPTHTLPRCGTDSNKVKLRIVVLGPLDLRVLMKSGPTT